ncbi:MraY family glycosyltransferase [Pseudomonas sp. S9]|uniref:MraY family glycosyltransferase n=1 Tax=Pseudomonas sp. S9 TaxID=686578 RepID=UPI000310B577|nr:glycosyltransferase family 4 protein [Pseudomonas sp. S9]
MSVWWVLPLSTLLAFIIAALYLKYALSHNLLDAPNARSSHSIPTPRGGGVSIVISFSIATCIIFFSGLITPRLFVALSGAGIGIAIVGFLDDRKPISARWRLVFHFIASIWVLYFLGGLPVINIAGVEFYFGWIGHLLAVLYLIWLLNLYNFMDGINGIASVEAICACFGAALCYYLAGQYSSAYIPLVLAFSVLGFLYWNFPRAQIFMGDAGSGFLGIVLGGVSIHAAWVAPQVFWCWMILLGVFIVDATFTLFRRLVRGEKVYEAHRTHAYQNASRLFQGHTPVTLAIIVVNLVWLLPLSLLVASGFMDGFFATLLAYGPLTVLALKFDAGELEVMQS